MISMNENISPNKRYLNILGGLMAGAFVGGLAGGTTGGVMSCNNQRRLSEHYVVKYLPHPHPDG